MGRMSREKGAKAERELASLLCEHLGDVTRNLAQTRDGGHDLIGVGPFAVEVKRRERLDIAGWWRQACGQANESGLVPALAYRQSRKPWRFVVPLGVFVGNVAPWDQQAVATVEVDGFVLLVRERIGKDKAA